jgi:ribokinase
MSRFHACHGIAMRTIYVAGSVNVDLVALAERLPRPGETVAGHGFARHAGGKGANQAMAAAKLGGRVALVAKVGDDALGAELCELLAAHGVDVQRVQRVAEVSTGVALITVAASGQNAIVVVPGANACLAPSDVEGLPFTSGDVAVAQLEIPLEAVEQFMVSARAAGATTILNAAPARSVPSALLDATDVLVVNETELAHFAELSHVPSDATTALEAARRLRRRSDQVVIVTLGAQGAVAALNGGSLQVPGHRVTAVDTTGAGDTFTGAMAAALADALPLPQALERANAAAAYSVERAGAAESSPTSAQLAAWLREH